MATKTSTASDRIRTFKEVEAENGKALKALYSLRTAFDSGDLEGVREHYATLFDRVYQMGDKYRELDREYAYLQFCGKLREIEAETSQRLSEAVPKVVLGLPTDFDFYSEVEEINYQESGRNYDNFKSCETFHDLIRCLHGSSTNALFSAQTSEGSVTKRSFDRGEFVILNDCNQRNMDLVDALYVIYEKPVEKRGSESFRVVLTDDMLVSRVIMGCHWSYFDSRFDEEKGKVFLRFANTLQKDYPNAMNRAEYVAKCMKNLGFVDIERFNEDVLGNSNQISRKDIPKFLTETARMLASTKDLDVDGSGLNGRVDEAVKAFVGGRTDIYRYLNS